MPRDARAEEEIYTNLVLVGIAKKYQCTDLPSRFQFLKFPKHII